MTSQVTLFGHRASADVIKSRSHWVKVGSNPVAVVLMGREIWTQTHRGEAIWSQRQR